VKCDSVAAKEYFLNDYELDFSEVPILEDGPFYFSGEPDHYQERKTG